MIMATGHTIGVSLSFLFKFIASDRNYFLFFNETYGGLSQVRVQYLTPIPHDVVQGDNVSDQELHCPSIGSGIG